jgi:hypothetical protein
MVEATKRPVMAAVKNMTAERDKELVMKLEEFVKLAKEGHLSDIAIICKVRGEPMTEFEWDSDDPLSLIGALALAQNEVTTELLDSAHPPEED